RRSTRRAGPFVSPLPDTCPDGAVRARIGFDGTRRPGPPPTRAGLAGRPDERATRAAGSTSERENVVEEPQAWVPTDPRARPSHDQVVAGLKGTTEGGEELVQLLSPEGERSGDPRFDAYAADVGVNELQSLYRDMLLVRRADREGNALQR